jgi:hypothetical protein
LSIRIKRRKVAARDLWFMIDGDMSKAAKRKPFAARSARIVEVGGLMLSQGLDDSNV